MSEISTDGGEGNTLNRPLSDTDRQRIRNELLVNLVREGMTAAEAGRRVGLKRSQASHIAKLYGVERKVGRPRVMSCADEALLEGQSSNG